MRNNGVTLEHLGNNVFLNTDSIDVVCLYSQLNSTDDGYIVSLELKLRTSGERLAVICAYSSDNCDNDAVLNAINEECQRYSSIPKVIIHSLSSRLAEKLLTMNEDLVSTPQYSASSMCYTENVFRVVSHGSHAIDQYTYGDIFKLEFFYT